MWEKSDNYIDKLEKRIEIIKKVRQIAFDNMQCGIYDITNSTKNFKKCTLSELGDYYDIKRDNYTIYKLLVEDDNSGSFTDVDEIENIILDDFREYLKSNNYITKDNTFYYKNNKVYNIAQELITKHLEEKNKNTDNNWW